MTIHSDVELAGMRAVGRLVADTLQLMVDQLRPGMTTGDLDLLAERFARKKGAESAPQLTYNFPGFTCISVNEEIVHGVPGTRVIGAGDVVKLDVTLKFDGYIADSATTAFVPPVSLEGRQLLRCARQAFKHGAAAARPGREVRAIGKAIEMQVRRAGFAVFRELAGHGLGRRMHEAPSVPNFPDPTANQILNDGVVIAIEPMVTARPTSVVAAADGFTIRTQNRAIAVHHEHTIVVRRDGAEILTARRNLHSIT